MSGTEETNSSTESETTTTETTTQTDQTTTEQSGAGEQQQQQEQAEQKTQEQKTEETPAPLTVADIKLPEGFEASEEMLTSLTDVMNDANLSAAERTEKLMNLHADAMKQASEEISEQWAKTREGWVDQVKKDPEIGGDKLDSEVLPTIGKVVKEFGSEELRNLMDESGLGDHPEFVKFLYKIGKSFGEGTVVSGSPSDAPKTLADRLYGTKSGA